MRKAEVAVPLHIWETAGAVVFWSEGSTGHE